MVTVAASSIQWILGSKMTIIDKTSIMKIKTKKNIDEISLWWQQQGGSTINVKDAAK